MGEFPTMKLADLLTNYADGDGIGWPSEFAYLRTFDARAIADLTVSVAAKGFEHPILLGHDGRVWDGHHRLAVADALRWGEVPVQSMSDEEEPTS